MSDEELAALAAQGDDSAMAELIARMEPLARAKAARFPNLPLEEDDLLQEGMLGFLRAVRSFRPDKDCSFRTYAAVCIQNSIISAVRKHNTAKNAPNSTALPYDDAVLGGLIGSQQSPLDEFSSYEEAQRLGEFVARTLSRKEKEVLNQRLAGKSQSAIAAALGINPKSADNALQRIRKKLREYSRQ
ncbi:MAG: sigma-70 family RNA polymerase sigma factor [Oscillospiraceae bacterium]|nr:sigma-70 family RNA polymerase sigma factor [Oscillospiraceae bacterium]